MTMATTTIKDLGEGLILRRSTAADAEALIEFNARLHTEEGTDEPNEVIAAWVRDLMRGDHPTFGAGDFTIVEDTRAGGTRGGRIVSSLNMISQTWSYGGVELGVGRPELVGTLPDYRRRGLARAQMEAIHAWSAERGHLLQAITGIPWYYRQFGYEMALELGGGRVGYAPHVPQLKDGEAEPYAVRPATEDDLAFIAGLSEQRDRHCRVACVRDAALWRYELRRSPHSVQRLEFYIIETPGGEPVGALAHPAAAWGQMLSLRLFELVPGVSWLAVTPVVIRKLWAAGQALLAREGKELRAFAFRLGHEHPAYEAAANRLVLHRPPYAWYVRVPDLPRFLRHVAPALERSLAASAAVGYSGELKLNFYRSGLRLVLEQGRLAAAEPWKPSETEEGSAGFPDLSFLQLVFGFRSLKELRAAFPDCWVTGDDAPVVLAGLFPQQSSAVWPIA